MPKTTQILGGASHQSQNKHVIINQKESSIHKIIEDDGAVGICLKNHWSHSLRHFEIKKTLFTQI